MKWKKIFWYILPIFSVMLMWEIISRQGPVNQVLFPPPSAVLLSWWDLFLRGLLIRDFSASFWRLGIGLIIGSSIGLIVGLLTGRIRWVHNIITPFIQTFRPLPAVAIIPLIIIWFGIDNGAKIFTISFGTFFPVWINTHIGAQQIPRMFLWSARLFDVSSIKLFSKVILPAASPFGLSGVRTGSAVACAMVFVSELAGASSGIGYRIMVAQSAYRIDEMMAALITLGLIGVIIDLSIILLTKIMMPWHKTSHESYYH